MATGLTEIAVEILTVAGYALLSGVLTVAGLLSEQTAAETFATGPAPLALWFVIFGAAAIYGGVALVGRELLLTRLRVLVA